MLLVACAACGNDPATSHGDSSANTKDQQTTRSSPEQTESKTGHDAAVSSPDISTEADSGPLSTSDVPTDTVDASESQQPQSLEPGAGWPEFMIDCNDIIVFGEHLVVVADQGSVSETQRTVHLVDLQTGKVLEDPVLELMLERSGAGSEAHIATNGEKLFVAGEYSGGGFDHTEVLVLTPGTLDVEARLQIEGAGVPFDVAADSEQIYVAGDRGVVRRLELGAALTLGENSLGASLPLYSHQLVLEGDYIYSSQGGLMATDLFRIRRDKDEETEGHYSVTLDDVQTSPWAMAFWDEHVYLIGASGGTPRRDPYERIRLSKLAKEDGTVVGDVTFEGEFFVPDIHMTITKTGLFYTREVVGARHEVVRVSLDDMSEAAVGSVFRSSDAIVADENFIYICSSAGLHRYDATTLELAGP